jgi:glycosyltransferase involved in cell wall biosynthesis
MTLGIVYHMPFWQTGDGTLWEAEGSFARYVDSLAPYFDDIVLMVPVFDRPPSSGTRLRATNVHLAALPYFAGPRQFYPQIVSMMRRLREGIVRCDVLHLRIPSPAAILAFQIARQLKLPMFALIVGDYRALFPHLPYRGWKRLLFRAYVETEERAVSRIVRYSLAFANGAALTRKHSSDNPRIVETKTTTLRAADIATRTDTCASRPVRLLTVSRIDPRKKLRLLPEVVAVLQRDGLDVVLDIVGPPIGRIGEQEREAIVDIAARAGVQSRVVLRGAVPLDELMQRYADYDIFVLPTGPGEGIPRVLLEAMAAGLPVVTTAVAGIRSLVVDGYNGVLVEEASAAAVATAVRGLIDSSADRQRIIGGGYETARAHTLDVQAASMMQIVSRELGLSLPKVA